MSASPEAARDHLLQIARTVHVATHRLVDDVGEDESLVTAAGSPNHIRWLSGHLVTGAAMALAALGVKGDLPPGWDGLFSRGSTVNPDAAVFPSMAEVRRRLRADHERIQAAIRGASPEDLERENEILPGWRQNAADAVHFFVVHEFYHAGQIATIRHALGRPGAFG